MIRIIVTFAIAADAHPFAAELRRRMPLSAAVSRLGDWGQPWDGHALVAAWVPDERAVEARDMATAAGGTLHQGPGVAGEPAG